MNFWEILLLAVGVSMDAFAVSIGKGLSAKRITLRELFLIGLWFGGFQVLMPVIGYYLGGSFTDLVEKIDHWIAFALLAFIGGNMIREALLGGEQSHADASFCFRTMLVLAVATSIDAFAVGISFSMQKEIVWLFGGTSIFLAVGLIGCTTFVLSLIGIVLGHRFGMKYRRAATIFGGAILVLIGIKILLEAYGLLPPLLSCQLS